MESPVSSGAPAGFLRRHKRFFLVLGGIFLLFVLVVVVGLVTVLYKASQVYSRPVPDIVPHDAAIYVECLELREHWPDVEGFLATVRNSRSYRGLDTLSPAWRKLGVDRALDEMLEGLRRTREDFGLDLLEAAASSETALALFLPPEGAEPMEGKRPKPSFLIYTRLSTWRVRIAALFPGTVAGFAAQGNLAYDGSGPHGKLVISGKKASSSLFFTVLKDVLILSDRSDLLDRTLTLADSEVPTGLASNPGYIAAMEATTPAEPAPIRFWVDFDKFDTLTKVRKKSEFRLALYPFNYAGQVLNELQRAVVDLKACRTLAGWIDLGEDGRVEAEGAFLYAGAGESLLPSTVFEPNGAFASKIVPAGALTHVTVQGSFGDFWRSLLSGKKSDGKGSFDKFLEKYGERIDGLLPDLGPDFGVFFRSHPRAATPGEPPPVPWTGVALRCRDPHSVTALIREIFDEQATHLAKKTDLVPYLSGPQTVGEMEILFVEDITQGVRDPIAPDFAPGIATWRDHLILFTSREYVFDMVESLQGNRPSLAEDPVIRSLRGDPPSPSNFSVFIDTHAVADAVAQPRYRMGIAKIMLPDDNAWWNEVNDEIRRKFGTLPEPAFERHQEQYLRKRLSERSRRAVEIAKNASILKVLRALDVAGTYLVGGEGGRCGLRARLTLLFDTE
jgi:hypothetical protein